MSKRSKQVEEEAKLEENYRPTEELQADEEKPHIEVPWTALIICGVLLLLAIVCIIVIFALGGPVNK
ncbi:MAG: hypothetical protein K5906_00110 [Bacilli bacterium]|nr:hypothetical protein [Bacilli bacterium]